jgi:aquaporin Z
MGERAITATNPTDQKSSTAIRRSEWLSAITNLRRHWPEYLMEVGELGLYLCVACLIATLLEHPASIVRQFVSSSLARRAMMGLAMGATAIAIVTSPWGKRSGGHLNPAITFTFFRLKKLDPWDAGFYAVAQFLGATLGVAVARYALRGALGDDSVHYAVTAPGVYGTTVAFVAELTISFILMITILITTNRKSLAPYGAYANGVLLAVYYAFEAPLSGMSTNPARTFGSAFHANYWHALWVYLVAPSIGMIIGGEVFLRCRHGALPFCAKLHHTDNYRCIFHHSQEGMK